MTCILIGIRVVTLKPHVNKKYIGIYIYTYVYYTRVISHEGIYIYIHTHTQGYVVLDGFEFSVEAVCYSCFESSFDIGVVGSYGTERVVAGPLRMCFGISFRVFFM